MAGKKRDSSTQEIRKVTPNVGKPSDGKNSHAQHTTGTQSATSPCRRLSKHCCPYSNLSLAFYLRAGVLIPHAILSSPDTQKYIYFWLTPLISYSPCNSEECFQCVIRRSQDLSVLLMQAVYLHAALLTSVGVSQITCNCGSLYFAWCS